MRLETLYVCTPHIVCHMQTWQVAVAQSAQEWSKGGHQAVTRMQISAQLATEGVQYNQSLMYTSMSCQASTCSSIDWKGLVGEHLHLYLQEKVPFETQTPSVVGAVALQRRQHSVLTNVCRCSAASLLLALYDLWGSHFALATSVSKGPCATSDISNCWNDCDSLHRGTAHIMPACKT